jgi:hypothetical protein
MRPGPRAARPPIAGRPVLRARLGLGLILALAATPTQGYGNGLQGDAARGATTRFETFVALACPPCLRTSYAVARVPTPPLKLPGFGLQVANTMARAGEIQLEVVRAHPIGRASRQFVALRIALAVQAGGGQLYRFVSGLADDEDVPALVAAVAAMSGVLATDPSAESPSETTELEFHTGTIRVGALRIPGAAVAYVQVGDVHVLPPPTTSDAQNALFVPIGDLTALHTALGQAADRIQRLRGQ